MATWVVFEEDPDVDPPALNEVARIETERDYAVPSAEEIGRAVKRGGSFACVRVDDLRFKAIVSEIRYADVERVAAEVSHAD